MMSILALFNLSFLLENTKWNWSLVKTSVQWHMSVSLKHHQVEQGDIICVVPKTELEEKCLPFVYWQNFSLIVINMPVGTNTV